MKRTATLLLLGVALLLVAPTSSLAQEAGTVQGTVLDQQSGDILPGANITIQETGFGTATEEDGTFRITGIPPGEYTLEASFVGYETETRNVTVQGGSSTSLRIQLEVTGGSLEEILVTGYSQQERQKLSTSISSVGSEDLESNINTNAESALQGKVPGVTISSTTGGPGGGFQVRVRGATSVNASNQPLYVVDGVPVAQGQFTDGFTGQQTVNNALSNVDVGNIESIEVLKGPAATAIYGTRASNGVVLIQTKGGSIGQNDVSFSYSVGATELPDSRIPNQVTGPEFSGIMREAYRNDCSQLFGIPECNDSQKDTAEDILAGEGVIFSSGTPDPDEPGTFPDSTQTTFDYVDAIQRSSALKHDANFSYSGGQTVQDGSSFRYFVSGNLLEEEGYLQQQSFTRYGGRARLNYSWAENRADVSANARYNQSINDVQENDNNIDGMFTNALLGPPFEPIFDEDEPGGFNQEGGAFANPVSIAEIKREIVNTKFLGNVEFSYDFLPSLSVTVSGGLDRFDQNEEVFAPSFTREGAPRGSGQNDIFTYSSYVLDATVNYDETFDGGHDVVAVGGASVEQTFRERLEVLGDRFPSDQLQTLSAAANVSGESGQIKSVTGIQSFFGSVDYSYQNRYLGKLTARADGSSRFGENNRWGFFPAASLGWNAHEESFLEGVSWISQLKLRVSAGLSGNQEFGINGTNMFTFPAQQLYGNSVYDGSPSFSPGQLANPNLQWESTRQVDIGLDFGFFDQRLSGTVEVYQKNTDDLLLTRPLPNTSGYTGIQSNIGSIKNRGIEFQLSTVNVETQNFQWTSELNASSNANEVTSLVEGTETIERGFASVIREGEPLGSFRGWEVVGIFDSQEEIDNHADQAPGTSPGDFKFADQNGDGTIDADDRTIIGHPQPDVFGGFRNTFQYRGLQLSAFVQYSYGNDVFNATKQFFGMPGFIFSTKDEILDRWTPEDQDTNVPRATLFDPNNNGRESSYFVEDGSYARLKSVTLSYQLPSSVVNRVQLEDARIYVSGKNLLTVTDYSGLDPEINSFGQDNVVQGNDFFTQPIPRFIQAGIEISL